MAVGQILAQRKVIGRITGLDMAKEPDRSAITIVRGGISFAYEIQPGDDWRVLPKGELIVTNPDRKPMRIYVDEYGTYRQEVIEAGEP